MASVPRLSLHKRNHSWPPLNGHVSFQQSVVATGRNHHHHHGRGSKPTSIYGSSAHHQPEIDDDPFAYFLSAADELEEYVSDYMNADIEIKPRPRSLSPAFLSRPAAEPESQSQPEPESRSQSQSQSQSQAHAYGLFSPDSPTATAIFKLKRWLERMEIRYFPRRCLSDAVPNGAAPTSYNKTPTSFEELVMPPSTLHLPSYSSSSSSPRPLVPPYGSMSVPLPALLPVPLSPTQTQRGRRTVRRSSRSIGNPSVVRSHSVRPRAWREPSTEIWTLSEEGEEQQQQQQQNQQEGLAICV